MRDTEKIKKRYGARCFRVWGAEGGNPVLIAQREGRVTIRRKAKKG